MGKWREWVNNNSAIVTVGAVVLLIVSLTIMIYFSRGKSYRPTVIDVYYYDLATGKTFVAKSTEIPPIDTASGAEMGVRAYVFGCGDCAETNQFIGYLERYSPEAKKAQVEAIKAAEEAKKNPPAPNTNVPMPPPMMNMPEMNILVRAEKGNQWVPMMSEQGMKLMESIERHCESGKRLIPCLPGKK